MRDLVRFRRGHRAWRVRKGNTCIPGRSGKFRNQSGSFKQRLGNGVRSEGLSEVGLLHISDDMRESARSEGSSKLSIPEGKHTGHRRP